MGQNRRSTLDFEWDEAKDRENLRKHDVGFEVARLVFDDPLAITVRADSDEAEEERWVTIGSAGGSILVLCCPHMARRSDCAADLGTHGDEEGEEEL